MQVAPTNPIVVPQGPPNAGPPNMAEAARQDQTNAYRAAPGSCQESAVIAMECLKKQFELPSCMCKVVLRGNIRYAKPQPTPSGHSSSHPPKSPDGILCSSEWIYDPEHHVWQHLRDLQPAKIDGIMHFVAATVVCGRFVLVDWGTGQFAEIPAEARLFLAEILSR
jgi:hypothetical protein